MRKFDLLGGVAALTLLALPALAQPAPATPPPPDAKPAPDTMAAPPAPNQTPATPDTTTPSTPGPATMAPAAAPAAPASDPTIQGATQAASLSATETPDQPTRLYVVQGTSSSGSQVQIVTNGPVPDTVENRKLYRPLSHAGRRSKPVGN